MKLYFAGFSFLLFILIAVSSSLTTLEALSISFTVYFFLEFLYNLGKKIVIMDLAVMMALFTCLIMPAVFYHEYTRDNPLARVWVKYMPIPTDEYFSFALPAILAMILGLRLQFKKLRINKNPVVYLDNIKKYLSDKPTLGLKLIAIGLASGFLDFLSPDNLKQVFYFMDHLTYVGVFYVIYSPNKFKRFIVPGVIALMVGQSLITGMFGEFIYMLACSLTLIFLGKQISFSKKITFALLGVFFILIIQSVKVDYRNRNWRQGVGADPIYFGELVTERLTDATTLLNPNKLFFTAVRMNQGWLVALTMKRVPARFPFANGETIFESVAASIVPRFLWPDKPESGGRANLKRFWGYNLVGFSMNIGPLGEAYGNFGVLGGIIYMFFYGLFFNIVLSGILRRSEKIPTLTLWLPFLFLYAISVETDLLTTMGSLIKGVFFMWIVFRFFRIAFRTDL